MQTYITHNSQKRQNRALSPFSVSDKIKKNERNTMNTLEKKREEINTIDAQLVSLFEKRMHTVEDIINYKLENNIPILDTGREAENIARTTKLIQDPQLIQYFENWYRYTMQVSKDYQQQIKNAENG